MICAEGKGDIGVADEWCGRTKGYVTLDGWLQPLIRSIKGPDVEMIVRRRSDLTILPKDAKGLLPMPPGHGAKALIAMRAAVLGSYDAVVFMVDADTTDIGRWKEIERQIFDGFSRVANAVVGIACIPMSTSESWLLADIKAWTTLTGASGLPLPSKPEEIWGKRDDPKANHPHQLFARICVQAGQGDDHSTRRYIAELMDAEAICRACPISFVPFYTSLKAA